MDLMIIEFCSLVFQTGEADANPPPRLQHLGFRHLRYSVGMDSSEIPKRSRCIRSTQAQLRFTNEPYRSERETTRIDLPGFHTAKFPRKTGMFDLFKRPLLSRMPDCNLRDLFRYDLSTQRGM
jgi:hypothetical protein